MGSEAAAAAVAEDVLLRHIFAVSLDPETAKGSVGDAPIVLLSDLAQVRRL